MDRRWAIVVAVALLALMAGCMEADSRLTIDEDGELHEMEIEVTLDEATWQTLESFAEMGGYDSVEEMILEEEEEDEVEEADDHIDCEEGAEEVSVDEDAYTIHMVCTEPIVADGSLISIELSDDGDTVTYRDEGSAEMDDGGDEMGFGGEPQVNHTVVMPGEITDSNAHEVDGQEATWDINAFEGDELYAESGTELGVDDDGATGFTLIAAAAAMLALIALAYRRL